MTMTKGVTAGAAGAGVFLLFLLAVRAPFLLSLGAGAAVFAAVALIWRSGPASVMPFSLDDTSVDYYKRTIDEGSVHARTIKSYIPKVQDAQVRGKIQRIADVSDRIFEILQDKPRSVKVIRQFFTYYLETTSKILGKYLELKRQNLHDPEVVDLIARTEGNLDMIADLFEQKLKKLVSDDVLDLDVELDMLQTMLKTEGLK